MELFDRRGVPIRYAEDIRYDNTFSGLTATQVQAALDEIISTFTERAQDAVAAALTDTTEIDWTYDDPGNSITATLRDNSIAYARLVNETGLSVLGRASNTSGVTAPIVASADGQVLLRNSSAVAWTSPSAPVAGLTISTALAFALANDLAALEGLASTGFAVRTTTDTWAQRSLAAPAAGFTITNPAGIVGNPTFVLANDLGALEALAGTGFAVRTTTDTWAQRTLTAPAAGFTITNPAGIAGDPTFVLANDLAGLEGLSTNGVAVRTAASTWTTRTNTGTSNRITVSNGDGVLGDPTYDISAVYVGQTSITTLGTVTTGTWSATAIGETKGGTNQTSYTLGDLLYASAANTLSKLAGNTTGTKKFLRQTGTGTISAAPAWDTLVAGDVPDLGANPSATFGANLTGANGTATTYLRSDAVLKLDQGIIPTWTETHTWTDNDKVVLGTGSDLQIYHDGTNSHIDNSTGWLILTSPPSGGGILIGGTTLPSFIDSTNRIVLSNLGQTGSNAVVAVAEAGIPVFGTIRVNGTFGSPTAILNNDLLGAFSFGGSTNSGTQGSITFCFAAATENWTATQQGGRLQMQWNLTGSTTTRSCQFQDNSIRGPDGTVGAPTWGYTADTDTGFYRIGSNNVGLSLGGTLRYNFTTSQFRLATTGGSITAPDLAGDGDTNTGIFWSAADTLQMALGGVNACEFGSTYVDHKVQERATGIISPTQLVANTDDWNPTNLATAAVIRASTDASRNLTGLQGGTSGRRIKIWNVGSFNLVLKHNVTSTAANQFLLKASADVTLTPNDSISLWYDSTASRWRQEQ